MLLVLPNEAMYLVVMLASCLVVPGCCALGLNGTETDSAGKNSSLYAQGGRRNVTNQGFCQEDEDCLARDQRCMAVGFLPHPRVCKCPKMFTIYLNGTCQMDFKPRLGQPCNSTDDCWTLLDTNMHCNGTGLRNATGTCVCDHGFDEVIKLGMCIRSIPMPSFDIPPIDLSTFHIPSIDLPPVHIPSSYGNPPTTNGESPSSYNGRGGIKLVCLCCSLPCFALSACCYYYRLRRRRNAQTNARTSSQATLVSAVDTRTTSLTPGVSVIDLKADVSPPSYDEVTKSGFHQANQSNRHISSLTPSTGQGTLHVDLQRNIGLPSVPPLVATERNPDRCASTHQTFQGFQVAVHDTGRPRTIRTSDGEENILHQPTVDSAVLR